MSKFWSSTLNKWGVLLATLLCILIAVAVFSYFHWGTASTQTINESALCQSQFGAASMAIKRPTEDTFRCAIISSSQPANLNKYCVTLEGAGATAVQSGSKYKCKPGPKASIQVP